MCSSTQHENQHAAATPAGALTFRVDDMTCGHCAGTITGAIESAFPGAKVTTDLAGKLVSITGATDAARVAAVVRDAGYTPA